MKGKRFGINIFMVICLCLVLYATNAFGAIMGDVDDSQEVDLRDTILALQICAGMAKSASTAADVNGDDRIGLEEAIFVLQTVAQAGTSDVVVYFLDENLETAIRESINKANGDILIADLQGLTSLDASILFPWGSTDEQEIKNLEGIQYCTNLTWLDLSANGISDISTLAGLDKLTGLELSSNDINNISALAGLTSLTELDLSGNDIIELSALAGLTNLISLDLYSNDIVELSALAGLTRLTELDLSGNQISDVGPLLDNSGLGSGDTIYLYKFFYAGGIGNPLSATSCNTYIPQLKNRGVNVSHDCP